MKKRAFESELQGGHKGPAVIVPFDPEEEWGLAPEMVTSDYGRWPGHLVKGRLNGEPFEGWIGNRWGRFFILVDEQLRRAAKISVGDTVEVVVEPRTRPAARAASAPPRRRARKTSTR